MTKSAKRRARREAQFREVQPPPEVPATEAQPEPVTPAAAPEPEPQAAAAPVPPSPARALVRNGQTRMIVGQGMAKPGESFGAFKARVLPQLRGTMQEFAEGISKDPNYKLTIIGHPQVGKLIRSWLDKGAPDNFSIDHGALSKESEQPGSVHRIFPNQNGDWEMNPTDQDAGPGIYYINHGVGDNAKASYEQSDQQQRAIGHLHQSIARLDFPRVNAWARQAAKSGMSDEDISAHIDQALPSAKEAAKMPMPHILAIASAASPEKRKEYLPMLSEYFNDLSSLSPENNKALSAHIQALTS